MKWEARLADGSIVFENWTERSGSPWQRLMEHCSARRIGLIALLLHVNGVVYEARGLAEGYWTATAVTTRMDGESTIAKGIGWVRNGSLCIIWAQIDDRERHHIWSEERLPTDRQIIWSR